MRYIYILFVLFFIQGCLLDTKTINTQNFNNPSSANFAPKDKAVVQKDSTALYNIQIQTVKTSKNIHPSKSNYTGSIKGIIKTIKYDKNRAKWLYEVVGKDTSNAKLPYAKFYDSKKLANVGDYVYIVLNNSILRNLFFIKKANKITKRVKKSRKNQKTKKPKKTKSYQKRDSKMRKIPKISVPTVENVVF
jgi:hypothetical protein